MKLQLLTTLAIHAALAVAESADADLKVMPELIGADVLADVSAKPDYCNEPTPPDYFCYKSGYPKCCTKKKKCPSGDAPSCECENKPRKYPDGNCNPDVVPARNYRCLVGANECGSREYCALEEAQCLTRVAGHYGRCEAIPQACRILYDPVCGCDGVTYASDCYAAEVGVNVAHSGECAGTAIPLIPRGGVCQNGIDVCDGGYSCVNGRCAIPLIPPGGVCQNGISVCDGGYSCVNGRCATPLIPNNGACDKGHPCDAGQVCLGGMCSTGKWYTNWQYCIMDCPKSADPCCGGLANPWNDLYSSAEACCGQPAFNNIHEGCTSRSLQCTGGDVDGQKNLIEAD